jgi:putative flippase GtrA
MAVIAVKYLIGGAAATIAHLSVLLVLVELFHINPSISTSIGFCIAVVINYNFQYHWTFASSEAHSRIFPRYVVVTFVMLGVNLIVFLILTRFGRLPYIYAQLTATALVMVCNFAINRRYTFGR